MLPSKLPNIICYIQKKRKIKEKAKLCTMNMRTIFKNLYVYLLKKYKKKTTQQKEYLKFFKLMS
jgi:hypothetical protein